MSTVELQKRLIEKIQSTNDDQLLEEAFRLFEVEIDNAKVYTLNEKQQEAIAEGRTQIANGKYLTDEESNKDVDAWLSRSFGLYEQIMKRRKF